MWEISDDGQEIWTIITGADTEQLHTAARRHVGKYLRALTVTYTDSFGSNKTGCEPIRPMRLRTLLPTNQQPAFATETATRAPSPRTLRLGENIGDPVAATHADSKGTLVYSLDTTAATNFDIESSTGQLKTKAALDHEGGTTSYTVTVSISDGLDDYENTDTVEDDSIEVTIDVTNILMCRPFLAQPTVEAADGAAAKLNVSWTAVAATDEAPVDGYDVQYREKDTQTPEPHPGAHSTDVTVSPAPAPPSPAWPTAPPTRCRCGPRTARGESGWSDSGEGSIPSELNVSFSSGTYSVTRAAALPLLPSNGVAGGRPGTEYSGLRNRRDCWSQAITRCRARRLSFASGDSSKTFTISTTDDSDRDATRQSTWRSVRYRPRWAPGRRPRLR